MINFLSPLKNPSIRHLDALPGIAGENIDAWAGGPPAWFVNADGPMGMMDAFAAEEEEEEEEEEDDDDEEGPWGV